MSSTWQENKSLAERQRHMLRSGLLSDVTFDLGTTGVSLPAHRHMLVAASPVFEAMFCGPLKPELGSGVKIEDIQEDIFRELLR